MTVIALRCNRVGCARQRFLYRDRLHTVVKKKKKKKTPGIKASQFYIVSEI